METIWIKHHNRPNRNLRPPAGAVEFQPIDGGGRGVLASQGALLWRQFVAPKDTQIGLTDGLAAPSIVVVLIAAPLGTVQRSGAYRGG